MRINIIYIVFVFNGFLLFAQDPLSSHYNNKFLFLNPAFTGTSDAYRFYGGYRNQWPSMGKAFLSQYAGYDQPVDILRGGLGAGLFNDMLAGGIYRNTQMDISYSHFFKVSRKWQFSVALQTSLVSRQIAYSGKVFPDVPEAIVPFSSLHSDFGSGFLAFYHNFYLGASLHNIKSIFQSSLKTNPYKIGLQGGKNFVLNKFRNISASIHVLILKQGSFFQVNYGGQLKIDRIYAGIWLRHDDRLRFENLVLSMGAQFFNYKVQYSYDLFLFNTNKFLNLGGHEISFILELKYKESRKSRMKAFECPKF